MLRWLVASIVIGSLWSGVLRAETIVFNSPESWQNWNIPEGIVVVGENGQLELKQYRKPINAAVDAPLFTQPTQQRGEVRGGIWQVGKIGRAHV